MAVPNLWRTKKQRYSLQGDVCPACSNTIFPPRQICPRCGSSVSGHQHRRGHFLTMGIARQPQQMMVDNPAGDD
ncbi:MAG: hypothetical protein KDD78_00585 [Caldilineaceae bacterium]|nr:hypothetical protein [Caldilineaceae bacterium]